MRGIVRCGATTQCNQWSVRAYRRKQVARQLSAFGWIPIRRTCLGSGVLSKRTTEWDGVVRDIQFDVPHGVTFCVVLVPLIESL